MTVSPMFHCIDQEIWLQTTCWLVAPLLAPTTASWTPWWAHILWARFRDEAESQAPSGRRSATPSASNTSLWRPGGIAAPADPDTSALCQSVDIEPGVPGKAGLHPVPCSAPAPLGG